MAPSGLTLQGSASAAWPCLIAAKLSGIELPHNAKDGALRLTTPDGVISGSTAVLRFIGGLCPTARLEGDSELEVASVDQWLEFAAHEACHFTGASAAASAQRATVLAALEARLARRTFLASNRVTLADVAMVTAIAPAPANERSGYPSVNRWYNTCQHQFGGATKGSVPAAASAGKAALAKAAPATTSAGAAAAATASSNGAPAAAGAGAGVGAPPELEVVSEAADNAALANLAALGITSTTYSHPAAMTVEDQMREIGHLPGHKTKNLFLRDKKGGALFLITARHDRPTDLKTLARLLGLDAKAVLRFADSAVLQEVLGVAQGSVGPLALVNDTSAAAAFAVDKDLVDDIDAVVNSHPLRNDRTTAIRAADLLKFAAACGHEPVLLDFDSAAAKAVAAAAGGAATDGPAAKAGGKCVGAAKQGGPKPAKPGKAAKPAAANGAGGGAVSGGGGKKEVKKETLLGIDKSKEEDFAGWYQQVITYSEMIDYYDISGCYILRPWAYEIWEHMQAWFDGQIKELGVQNAYFPLFVSKKALEAEKDHVEGFAPEVAWVTKSGDTDLAEPIAVRPTSETIMYPAYARWIRSHRDLPLLLNQWSNVVRWEFKYPTPFLRSREFLWQEGHTAHATFEEADQFVLTILELYRRVYEELLAVPVVKGRKTELEKFAGGAMTTTVEAYVAGSGRAIQGATSHNLGQNFGKMFKISFENKAGESEIPWQTSWGITTRTIGVCVMCHGDDRGLVLPPRVAPLQAVVIPIYGKAAPPEQLDPYCHKVVALLKAAGVRAKHDARDNYTAGWKYNHWEQKGVPLRLEAGPRDVAGNRVVVARRDDGSKTEVALANLAAHVMRTLDEFQAGLFARAKAARDAHVTRITEWKGFVPALEKNFLVLTPFCNEEEWEKKVKEMSRDEALGGEAEDERSSTSVAAKTLCIPFDQPTPLPDVATKCFVSGKDAQCWVMWGRSY